MFRKPDKIPLVAGDIRPLTRRSWVKQGLPENQDVLDYFDLKSCGLGTMNITSYPQEGREWKPEPYTVNLGPIQPFKPKVVFEDERYRVWVDALGITQKGLQDDWKDGWSGFATRVFTDFPVKNQKDFVEIKGRYNSKDPKRYPKNWSRIARSLHERNYPVSANIRGPFWWLRDMVGLKSILTGIYNDPESIREIADFCAEFHVETLHRALEDVEVDYVIISEDMAYKKGPMIGPITFNKFFRLAYIEIVRFLRDHGVKVIGIDSDGNVEALIPVWLELGINCLTPCEVAADMDVVKLGKKYPRLIMMGGIDKKELAKDKKAIEEELSSKVSPLIERCGYFPGVDHAVPPDVSLNNYRYFIHLLKKLCRW